MPHRPKRSQESQWPGVYCRHLIRRSRMSYDTYHKRWIGKHLLKPETQMMGYGYDPSLSEGALKPPIFLTSTFAFKSAQDGKDFFDYSSGRRELKAGQTAGLVYSRFNNPNLEVLEDRLALWEGGDVAAVFSSGMSAISTTLWAHVRPGDVLLMSQPLYGGTETLIERTLPTFGVRAVGFTQGCDAAAVNEAATRALAMARESNGRVCLMLIETPANPTNSLVDLQLMRKVSERIGSEQAGGRPPIAVDNTFLGPVFQRPLAHGSDIVMYSLTKYVGGHSDLVAGGVIGAREAVGPIKKLRGAFGFSIKGGEAEAFRLLDSLQVIKLAVSLGGTETLMSHPASTTHSGVPKETRDRLGVTDALIRISVGIEDPDDLIADLREALAAI